MKKLKLKLLNEKNNDIKKEDDDFNVYDNEELDEQNNKSKKINLTKLRKETREENEKSKQKSKLNKVSKMTVKPTYTNIKQTNTEKKNERNFEKELYDEILESLINNPRDYTFEDLNNDINIFRNKNGLQSDFYNRTVDKNNLYRKIFNDYEAVNKSMNILKNKSKEKIDDVNKDYNERIKNINAFENDLKMLFKDMNDTIAQYKNKKLKNSEIKLKFNTYKSLFEKYAKYVNDNIDDIRKYEKEDEFDKLLTDVYNLLNDYEKPDFKINLSDVKDYITNINSEYGLSLDENEPRDLYDYIKKNNTEHILIKSDDIPKIINEYIYLLTNLMHSMTDATEKKKIFDLISDFSNYLSLIEKSIKDNIYCYICTKNITDVITHAKGIEHIFNMNAIENYIKNYYKSTGLNTTEKTKILDNYQNKYKIFNDNDYFLSKDKTDDLKKIIKCYLCDLNLPFDYNKKTHIDDDFHKYNINNFMKIFGKNIEDNYIKYNKDINKINASNTVKYDKTYIDAIIKKVNDVIFADDEIFKMNVGKYIDSYYKTTPCYSCELLIFKDEEATHKINTKHEEVIKSLFNLISKNIIIPELIKIDNYYYNDLINKGSKPLNELKPDSNPMRHLINRHFKPVFINYIDTHIYDMPSLQDYNAIFYKDLYDETFKNLKDADVLIEIK